jgi:hypothetical protein
MHLNLFTYHGKKEDLVTNILMNILSLNQRLCQRFIHLMIDHPDTEKMVLDNIRFSMGKKKNPNSSAKIGIIIGLTPSMDNTVKKDIKPGVDASRPDLWIYGENFSILIENKIVGSLNLQQLANHRSKFSKGVTLEITRTWREVSIVLSQLNQDKDRIESYLIEQFIDFLSSEGIR